MSMEYTGIPYFPVNANFFEEEAIELLEAKFGTQASYIVLRLFCKIYKEGYYITWGKEQCLIFLRKIGGEVDENTMDRIIGLLLEKGVFNKECYEKHGILTSENIQKIWLEATVRRKMDVTQLPYLVVEINESRQNKRNLKTKSKRENVDNPETQSDASSENADIPEQSKANKTKTEETKANKIRQEKNKASSSSKEDCREEGKVADSSFQIPEYAFNKATHNVNGLLECMERYKVTDPKDQQAILRLSDYGKKETPVWKLFLNTNWNKIGAPGKYIIAALATTCS